MRTISKENVEVKSLLEDYKKQKHHRNILENDESTKILFYKIEEEPYYNFVEKYKNEKLIEKKICKNDFITSEIFIEKKNNENHEDCDFVNDLVKKQRNIKSNPNWRDLNENDFE